MSEVNQVESHAKQAFPPENDNEVDNECDIRSKENMKKEYLKLLNSYNEIKDATQTILSAIANIEGLTLKKIHEKFELPLKD